MKQLSILLGFAAVLAPLPAAAQEAVPVPAPSSTVSADAYRLAPDDKVKINVYGEEALTGDYVVGSDGNISFPLVGMVKAGGLTLAELQDAVTRQLDANYVNGAKVSAEIAEYRPFYILGEVNKPGQYPYKVGLTFHAAIATAGGFTYRANKKKIAIQHKGETAETKTRVTPDLVIQPGDTIRILERFF